jgi:hypothetical protein
MNEPAPMLAIDDDELRSLLRGALAVRFGRDREVRQLTRRPWDYYSSFTIEALEVALSDGSSLSLLAKDLGKAGRLKSGSHLKPEFLYDPMREIEMYQSVLAEGESGAPDFFGSVVDPAAGRYLLLLERVNGLPIWQFAEMEIWRAAAQWLARFHQRHARMADASVSRHLIRYDRDYYSTWPRRALQFLRKNSAVSAGAVGIMDALAEAYSRVVDRLISFPVQLIHGELVASNILVQQENGNTRLRIVDWEMAGIGPPLMDLADLTGGNWTPEQKQCIADAYREALPPADRLSPTDFDDALNWCRLHKAVQWLGWAPCWTPPKEHAQDWLVEARRLAETLGVI